MLDVKALLTKILDALKADYVIEQGTDNSWTYRKWNSGLFEAWRYYQATGMTITTSSAGTYYGGEKSIALPSFVSTVTGTAYGNAPSQSSGVYIYEAVRDNTNLKVNYRSHSSVSNAACGGFFHVIGTWGGYSVTCFMSAAIHLAERWWRYVRHQETAHENTKTDELQNSICFCNFSDIGFVKHNKMVERTAASKRKGNCRNRLLFNQWNNLFCLFYRYMEYVRRVCGCKKLRFLSTECNADSLLHGSGITLGRGCCYA